MRSKRGQQWTAFAGLFLEHQGRYLELRKGMVVETETAAGVGRIAHFLANQVIAITLCFKQTANVSTTQTNQQADRSID